MSRPYYVCTTCTQDFTRKASAARHNWNLHRGLGKIVRLLDYLVGTGTGRYRPPDPSLHPRNGRKKTHSYYQFDSPTDLKKTPGHTNIEARSREFDPFADWDRELEAAEKVVAIRKCYLKILSPQEAHERARICYSLYVSSNDVSILDRELATASRLVKLSITMNELTPPGNMSRAGYSSLNNISSRNNSNPGEVGYFGDYIDNEMRTVINQSIDGLKNCIRERNASSFNRQFKSSSPDFQDRADRSQNIPSFLEVMYPGQNADTWVEDITSSANSTSSSEAAERIEPAEFSDFLASVRRDLSEFSKRFKHSTRRATPRRAMKGSGSHGNKSSPSSPQRSNKQSTSGKPPAQSSKTTEVGADSLSTRSEELPDKNLVIAGKLAELRRVLGKRYPPQEVESLVAGCRDHALINGHTGLLDEYLPWVRNWLG